MKTKSIFAFMLGLLLLCDTAFAMDKQMKITQNDLPVKAQEFLTNHFAQSVVKKVVKSTADDGVEVFFVTFKDKTRIEFDMVGAWSVITVKKDSVSDEVMPVRIRSVLRTNYAGKNIKMADNDGVHFHFVFDDKSEVRVNIFGEIME